MSLTLLKNNINNVFNVIDELELYHEDERVE